MFTYVDLAGQVPTGTQSGQYRVGGDLLGVEGPRGWVVGLGWWHLSILTSH